jgi:quercetin dioxygenase-like cupin family protein
MANIQLSEGILGKIKKPKGKVRNEISSAVKKALGIDLKGIEVHIKEASPRKVRRKEVEGKSLIRKTRVEFVNPDLSRKPEDGWMGFHIRWLIDDVSMGATQGTLGYAFFPPGSQHKMHKHDDAEEFTIYLRGRGVRVVGDQEYEVGPGDVAFVPKGVPHGIKSSDPNEPMELWCFYAGVPNVEKTGYSLAESK